MLHRADRLSLDPPIKFFEQVIRVVIIGKKCIIEVYVKFNDKDEHAGKGGSLSKGSTQPLNCRLVVVPGTTFGMSYAEIIECRPRGIKAAGVLLRMLSALMRRTCIIFA